MTSGSTAPSGPWEACWRVLVDDARRRRPFLIRRVRARRLSALRPLALAAAVGAWRGELRLSGPAGVLLYTDLARLARWDGAGLPEPDRSSLWAEEARVRRLVGEMLAGVAAALDGGRSAGIIAPNGAVMVLELAEELADDPDEVPAAVLASLRNAA